MNNYVLMESGYDDGLYNYTEFLYPMIIQINLKRFDRLRINNLVI